MHGTPVTVAAEYRQSTLKGTATCSSLKSTVSHETYVAGLRNLDVLILNSIESMFNVVLSVKQNKCKYWNVFYLPSHMQHNLVKIIID